MPKVPRVHGVGGRLKSYGILEKKWPGRFFFFEMGKSSVLFSVPEMGSLRKGRNGMGINPCIAGILQSTAYVVGYGEKKLRANHGI